jgi:hypothetical protein
MEEKMSVLDLFGATSMFMSSSTSSNDSQSAAVIFAFIAFYLVIVVVFYFVFAFILSRVFKKAGRPAWEAFVPIYQYWVLFEIAGKPGWWSLFFIGGFIPLIGFIFSIVFLVFLLLVSLEMAKRFNRSTAFGVIALWLFSLIGYIILAFGDSTYHAPGAPAVASPGSVPVAPQNPTPPQNPSPPQTPSTPPFVQ